MPQVSGDDLRMLQQMLGTVGDQRAKDLIDQNEGEDDPRRAIRRLHRALGYGRTSIRAGKAFQNLGMYCEDLGNARLAIKYYTASIDLKRTLGIEPVPSRYWRGKLLYERGDREAARRDLAKAIELEGAQSWFPEERAFAERVLAGEDALVVNE